MALKLILHALNSTTPLESKYFDIELAFIVNQKAVIKLLIRGGSQRLNLDSFLGITINNA